MACPVCGNTAQTVDHRCARCGASIHAAPVIATGVLTPIPASRADATNEPRPDERPPDLDETRFVNAPAVGAATPGGLTAATLSVGHDFGSRYHIIKLLGVGGMGAVYQAWDKTLEVAVAIKVIRPEATLDPASAQALLKRFKQELLLARQVTHGNVVRIHDLGENDGITYITMPYIQGQNLSTILKQEGRLPVDRAVSIARQVASGLAAAHAAGVVHRDLKPANIMIGAEDHALIMDFGIARSTSGATSGSITATGVIVGTVEYMAPEQARGSPVDHRADIYSLGLILHDLLLGHRHQGASTAVAELLSRMQQPPAPPRSIDPSIPPLVDAIVTKCLQPDPRARYQSINEVLLELERFGRPDTAPWPAVTEPAAAVPTVPGRLAMLGPLARRPWLAAAALLLIVLAGAGWALRDRLFGGGPPADASGPSISLVILPFRNASGDPTLDSFGPSVGQVLATTLGQSSRVRTVPPDRLNQVLKDLRITAQASLAPTELALVADFTNARHVLWGQYTRFGDAIRIDATLQDLDRDETVPLNALAPNESSLLNALSDLAGSVQQALARGSTDMLEELKSTAWKPSTSSFEALRLYNEGIQLRQQGRHQAAQKSFAAATEADGNFALAYSELAQSYSTLGYDTEAAQFSRRAMSLSDTLPPQEKHRIAASHHRIANDMAKAIESYENLAVASPNDAMVHFDLGGLYEQTGALEQARERFAKVIELDPKFVEGLRAMGRVEIKRGQPQPSLEHLDKALSLATQLDNEEARSNVLQAIGIAYMRLNRPNEALRRYQESLEIKERLGDKRGMAASYVQIGEVQRALGNPEAAEKSYRAAEKLRREIGDKAGLTLALMDLAALLNSTFGRSNEALPLLQEALTILRDTGNRNLEARALNNVGVTYASLGRFSEAQTYFERAFEIREKAKAPLDAADTLQNLAETLAKMGRYDQALQRYFSALELLRSAGDRRLSALAQLGIATVFDYQGRFGAAVKAKEEALQTFRELKLKDVWLGQILAGYGSSLSLSGRTGEAQRYLEEALAVGSELNNQNLIALTMRLQAERLSLSGDLAGATTQAQRAVEAAGRAADRTLALQAQAEAAMIASAAQPTSAVASQLGDLAQQADALGLKSLAVECAVQRAQTLLALKDFAGAQREAERGLARAEGLGLRVPLAKAHYVKAAALAARGDSLARRDYAAAVRVLEALKNEDGNARVLERSDLATIHSQALKASQGT